jgi:hypothetical protein
VTDAKREGELGKMLAGWADVRRQHEDARTRLQHSTQQGLDGAFLKDLETEVSRLRVLEDAGLEALQNLFDAMRHPPKAAVALQRPLDLD